MDEARVRKLADGRIYSGAQAKELGLIDQFGTLEDAIDLAAKQVGLDASPTVYYSRPEQERWWDRLFIGRLRCALACFRARLAALRMVAVDAAVSATCRRRSKK